MADNMNFLQAMVLFTPFLSINVFVKRAP